MKNNLSNFNQGQLEVSQDVSVYITKVYNWMALALFITGLVAYFTASSSQMTDLILSSKFIF